MSQIKLIVGLKNPGAEYAGTRHNAGAWYVERLAHTCSQSLKSEPKFFGLAAQCCIEHHTVRLLIPSTFMNLSGKAVVAMMQFYQIEPHELLVAHDELAFFPGVAKFRIGGGHAGHNGLRDIINKLGNVSDFNRLRIGIGHPGDKHKVTGFVLGKPPQKEQQLIDEAIDEAVRCTPLIFSRSLAVAMDHLHRN